MCANSLLSLFLLSLAGAAFSASIKGGINGTKGRWEPPKDWDWSVTPGRLIPVSEATDDLPTPGYRMSQLQQRIPPHHEFQPFPIVNVAVTNNTAEEKVVAIGQGQTPAEVDEGKVTNDLSTTQRLDTTENFEQSTPKEIKPQTALDEQELILLHDEPIVYQRESLSFETTSSTTEKVPVVEEAMEKVELPEICSISGIGCGDPKPVPQKPVVETTTEVEEHTEVLKHPKVVPHPHGHPKVKKNEDSATTTELSTEQTTLHQSAAEEHTTNRDQLPSDSHHIDQQVVQQVVPISTSVDESLGNNTSVSVPSNETNSQETVTLVIPQFNLTVPTVVHSVISSVSEHVGYSNSTKHDTESTIMNNATDSQQQIDESQVQLTQQEQQVQQEHVYSPSQLSQEAEVHQVDEQKLLDIANSWGSSDSPTHSVDRRMDTAVKKEKHEGEVTEESIKKEEVPNQEAVSSGHEMKEVTQPTEQKNSTESPTLGDRLESYWKAATGYVSKALNL
ncbi:uncharacterized protein [Halyomorpha halys]|uniref:uncharacterized protein n=1 Tax=Halyomorpha halys TaxID=286706 RepID=UPI0006D4CABC|nr:uncharacterized protein LOC106683565 [Halyomorpha halys]